MKKKLIEFENLSLWFSDINKRVMKNINFVLYEKEILALTGVSGIGKSLALFTLMHLLKNELFVTSGSIYYYDSTLKRRLNILGSKTDILYFKKNIIGRTMFFLFQDPNDFLIPYLTIREQFNLLLKHHTVLKNFSSLQKNKLYIQELKSLNLNKEILNYFPFQLSGGMKQLVSIIMLLIREPKLILCDEPTSSLDSIYKERILLKLQKYCRTTSASMLWISHSIPLIKKYSNRIVVLTEQSQKIKFKKKFNNAGLNSKQNFNTLVTIFNNFVKNNFAVVKKEKKGLSFKKIVSIKNLKIQISKKFLLSNITFDIFLGQHLSIIGKSGSGKTTLANILSNLKNFTKKKNYSGTISFNKNFHFFLAPQNSSENLNFNNSVLDNLLEYFYFKQKGYFFKKNSLEFKKSLKIIKELLQFVGLKEDILFKKPSNLSGGMKQRISLLKSIIFKPDILICDEVSSSLDIFNSYKIFELLKKFSNKTTLIIISHNLHFCKLTPFTLVLNNGKILEYGKTTFLFKHPKTVLFKEMIKLSQFYN